MCSRRVRSASLSAMGRKHEVREHGAVERREKRHRHRGTDLGRIVHVREHLDETHQRTDHSERGCTLPHSHEDALPVSMSLDGLDELGGEDRFDDPGDRFRRRRVGCPWRETSPRFRPRRERARSRDGRAGRARRCCERAPARSAPRTRRRAGRPSPPATNDETNTARRSRRGCPQ